MTIMQRYIARSVIQATALVFVVMFGLTFLIDLLEELRDVGSGDYGFLQAFIHVLLELPRSLYQFFPMLMLMGGVIGLGVLSSNQELVVMRAAGFSIRKIATSVVSAALLIIFFATIIGEGIVPRSHHLAESRKQSEQNFGQAVVTQSGVWIHEGTNFLHITRVVGLDHLEGVTRYQFDNQHRLVASYYIQSLDLQGKHKWFLHNVVKTSFGKNKTQSLHLPEATWDLVLNPNLLNVGLIEPAEMSLPTLRYYYTHLSQNGLQAAEFQWEFWKRALQPITTLVMILLAIPFVMRSSRTVTMGWRVLFGISIGFAFYILNAFLGQFSIVFQFSPLLAAIFPTLLFAVLGCVFALKLRN